MHCDDNLDNHDSRSHNNQIYTFICYSHFEDTKYFWIKYKVTLVMIKMIAFDNYSYNYFESNEIKMSLITPGQKQQYCAVQWTT